MRMDGSTHCSSLVLGLVAFDSYVHVRIIKTTLTTLRLTNTFAEQEPKHDRSDQEPVVYCITLAVRTHAHKVAVPRVVADQVRTKRIRSKHQQEFDPYLRRMLAQ